MTATAPLASSRRRRTRSCHELQTEKPFTLLVLLALLLGLPLAAIGGCLLLAGIASYQAQAFLDDWSNKGTAPAPHAWQIAHDAAQRAIDLYPVANGQYLHRLGLIHQWQHRRVPSREAKAQASQRAALQAFRAASNAQPSWPDHWTAIADTKLRLLEIDDEFNQAMAKAHELGPWRIHINRRLAEIGFTAWPLLDDAGEAITLEAARRTIVYSTPEAQRLAAIAEDTDMTDTLCAQLDDELTSSRQICQ